MRRRCENLARLPKTVFTIVLSGKRRSVPTEHKRYSWGRLPEWDCCRDQSEFWWLFWNLFRKHLKRLFCCAEPVYTPTPSLFPWRVSERWLSLKLNILRPIGSPLAKMAAGLPSVIALPHLAVKSPLCSPHTFLSALTTPFVSQQSVCAKFGSVATPFVWYLAGSGLLVALCAVSRSSTDSIGVVYVRETATS